MYMQISESKQIAAPLRHVKARHGHFIDGALVLLLCLFVLWPLLQHPGLSNGTDTLYHVYRAAEMDRSWSHGVLMPRWAESFYFGYGSPLFYYYASFTYYLTSIITRLTGVDAVNSLRLVIVLSLLASGGGMFAFVRGRLGVLAGVIAGVAYVYSPYIMYKEPYARGDFPEMLSFALLPLILWWFDRLLRRGRPLDFALSALSVCVLINTHNLMALVLSALLGAWLLWNGLTVGWRRVGLALVAQGIGVGLAASFWLPVIIERDSVQLANLVALAELDFRNFFVPLHELLQGVPRLDGGAVNGLMPVYAVGVVQWVLALAGVSSLVIAQRRTKSLPLLKNGPVMTALFFGGMALIFIFMMTPWSEFIWLTPIPFSFLQFPWRFLGPAAFCLAVLAGMNAFWLQRLSHRLGATGVGFVTAALIVSVMPLLYIPEWTNRVVDTSVAAYHRAEVSGRQLATTYSSEFLPATVLTLPDPTERLLEDYADGYPVDHAHYEFLPDEVEVALLANGPEFSEWRINAPFAFTFEVLIFDFAPWQAEIDSQPVTIFPADPHGLMTLDVPAGEHTVRVFLGTTPVRMAGIAIGVVSTLAGIALMWILWRRNPGDHAAPETLLLPHRYGLIVAAGVVLVVWALWMRPGGAWLESPPGQVLAAQVATDYRLGESIRLIGYDLNSRTFNPGDTLKLDVFWYTNAPIPYGYSSFVHISHGGPPLAQGDKLNPAGRPTKAWITTGYYRDPFEITLPPDMPAGEYEVRAGLYTCDTRPTDDCGNGDRLPVTDAQGNALGDSVLLGTVTIR